MYYTNILFTIDLEYQCATSRVSGITKEPQLLCRKTSNTERGQLQSETLCNWSPSTDATYVDTRLYNIFSVVSSSSAGFFLVPGKTIQQQ